MAELQPPAVESKTVKKLSTTVAETSSNSGPAEPSSSNSPVQVEYKIFKVRKQNGSIVRVRRPVVPSVVATANALAPAVTPTGNPHTPGQAQQATATSVGTASTRNHSVNRPDVALTSPSNATPQGEERKAVSSNKEVASPSSHHGNSSVNPLEKVSNPPSQSKPSGEVPTPEAPGTIIIPENAVSAFAFLGGLNRLHKHGSNALRIINPDWDIGDFEDGDEDMLDETENSDDDVDDDGDDDKDSQQHSENEKEGMLNKTSNSNEVGNYGKDIQAVTGGVLGSAPPPSYNMTQRSIPVKQTKSVPSENAEKATEHYNKGGVSATEKPTTDDENTNDAKREIKGRSLGRRSWEFTRALVWIITITMPLLFIVLGILVAAVHNRSAGSSVFGTDGDKLAAAVTKAIPVAVSAWPIIFAAIAAQSLRALATYKVERGIQLMTLEQLISSNSVASSIKQPFILRRINWTTIALLALWGLSPLASQALQRVLSSGYETRGTFVPIQYLNTSGRNIIAGPTLSFLGGASNHYSPDVNRMFSAAFLPALPTADDSRDAWGNPRIPVFENLFDHQNETIDGEVWKLANTDETQKYSSIFGIPIVAFDDGVAQELRTLGLDHPGVPNKYQFTLSTAYLNFKCQPLTAKNITAINQTNIDTTGSPLLCSGTGTLCLHINPMDAGTSGSLIFASQNSHGDASPYITTNFTYSSCTFSQTFVDSLIRCDGTACTVYAMKLTKAPPPISGMVDFSQNYLDASKGSPGDPTDTEFYIQDPDTISTPDMDDRDIVDLVTLEQFTERLAILINTFWQLGFAPWYATNNLQVTSPTPDQPIIANTRASRQEFVNIYTTNWAWLSVLMICSVFLLTAGIAAVIWDLQSISPDVLGFVSSVARRSKYVDLPKVDTAASGAERARLLGKVKVMMQDVKPNAEVGRIALGTVHSKAERLRLGRAYR